MLDQRELQSTFRGALLGGALGDALGAPFEGCPTVDPGALQRHLDAPSPISYTDDTVMTRGLARSLLACRGVDGAHLAATFARDYLAEPWRGYGGGAIRVFHLLAEGVPWEQAAARIFDGAGSYGNGAAMRVAPAALLGVQDPTRAAELARQTAVVTHTHELGVAGAALQATALARALRWPARQSLDWPAFLADLMADVDHPLCRRQLQQVARLLADEAPVAEVVAILGHGVAASEAVPAALYAFLRHHDDLPAAIGKAISLGGDTDTIACMTGALAGALLGEEAIPARWRQRLENGADLSDLADGLLLLVLEQGR